MQYRNCEGKIVSSKLECWEINRFIPAPSLLRKAQLGPEAKHQAEMLKLSDVQDYLANCLQRGDAMITKLRNNVYIVVTTKYYFKVLWVDLEIAYISVNQPLRRRKTK